MYDAIDGGPDRYLVLGDRFARLSVYRMSGGGERERIWFSRILASTGRREWQASPGFGTNFELLDIDGDGVPEIIGQSPGFDDSCNFTAMIGFRGACLNGMKVGRRRIRISWGIFLRILVVEDDREAARYLKKGLQESGFNVTLTADGDEGLILAQKGGFDCLIIDRMLPGMDGLQILEAIREQEDATPVLILSALDKVKDRIEGLKRGADDYLVKPFAFSELLARIEALIRRAHPEQAETLLKVGGLEMDYLTRQVTVDGTPVVLQPREFQLLNYMMRHAGQVVTRTMLLENVWEYTFDPQTNVVNVHISRLRKKLDPDGSRRTIETVRGAGYRLVAHA